MSTAYSLVRALLEDEPPDFDLVDAFFQLPSATEYWTVCAEPPDRWPQWVYVALPAMEFKNPTGAVVEPGSATGKEVVQAALKKGLHPDYVPYISVVRKITRMDYLEMVE